ncbi:hypothetical protein BAUCODRAFT_70745, partial [Baudoinia panamericana UAMH 10762]
IFSGSSHPALVDAICERLGTKPSPVQLRKFSNGETSVEISASVRDQDVFIVQSGSSQINDNVMEMLIMISACKGGSARSITAVMPYFPYSRQSKRKTHRGAITARMLANLMYVAGVNHVITIDLHASQMQGFFKCPVDNLIAEPILAKWLRMNVPDWMEAVVVSKNPGGTKRVTSLADSLKLSFGVVTTDRRRPHHYSSLLNSTIFESMGTDGTIDSTALEKDAEEAETRIRTSERGTPGPTERPPHDMDGYEEPAGDEDHDERARDVITGRLIHGHIVDDDAPSPVLSIRSGSVQGNHNGQRGSQSSNEEPMPEAMMQSFMSTASTHSRMQPPHHGLGGTGDATASDEEEEEALKDPYTESTVTLVGNVRDRPVLIVDDIIDKAGSWVAAAETVVKRGGATKVYCMATHGIFAEDALSELDMCEEIEAIVVTDAFPISEEKRRLTRKLVILDVSGLLSEAIRRNHHGESISQLYHYYD